MSNRERGEATLVTPTQTYTLRLTIGACCELEDRTEQDFDALTVLVNQGRVTALRWVLWASLQPYHASVFQTPESVSPIMESVGGYRAMRPILQAFLVRNLEAIDDAPEGKGEPDTRPGSIWRRLYLDARCNGLPPETFWSLTPLELWRELAAIRQRRRAEYARDLTQAWWVAALATTAIWQRKLPDLKTLLQPDAGPKQTKPQTWQDIKAALRRFPQSQAGTVEINGNY